MEILTLTTFLFDFIGEKGWGHIPEKYLLLFAITAFIVRLITLTVVLYIAGIVVVGKRRALFSDALVISLLGTVVGIICDLFFQSSLIGAILSLLVWLLLIRYYYETGWLGALAVGILAVIIAVILSLIVLFILALLLGFSFVFSGWLALSLVL